MTECAYYNWCETTTAGKLKIQLHDFSWGTEVPQIQARVIYKERSMIGAHDINVINHGKRYIEIPE